MAKNGEAYEIWWKKAKDDEKKEAFAFGEGYKSFLDTCKTEREVNAFTIALLKKHGFVPLEKFLAGKAKPKGKKRGRPSAAEAAKGAPVCLSRT